MPELSIGEVPGQCVEDICSMAAYSYVEWGNVGGIAGNIISVNESKYSYS